MQTGAQVANDAVQGLLHRIDQLADKLGTTAAGLWQIYVGQARLEGVRDSAVGVFFVVLSVVAFILATLFWKTANRKTENSIYSDNNWIYSVSIATIVAGTLLFLVSLTWFYGAFGEFYNPQYWAFQHLTADLKNLF